MQGSETADMVSKALLMADGAGTSGMPLASASLLSEIAVLNSKGVRRSLLCFKLFRLTPQFCASVGPPSHHAYALVPIIRTRVGTADLDQPGAKQTA